MFPPKIHQLLNGAIDNTIHQSSRFVSKEAQAVVFDMAITYNLHGSNPRININSQDHSINVDNSKIVFDETRNRIESDISDESLKKELRVKVVEMEQSVGQKTFGQKYSNFIASAANHMTIFAPLLPGLTQFLNTSGI